MEEFYTISNNSEAEIIEKPKDFPPSACNVALIGKKVALSVTY